MRRNVHPKLRIAASLFFLLLMITLQAGKLFHAAQHTVHDGPTAHSAPAQKHSAGITHVSCIACEFEYCREALPENAVIINEIVAPVTVRFIPSTVSAVIPPFLYTDWRGPPSC